MGAVSVYQTLPRGFVPLLVSSGGTPCSAFPVLVKQETSIANFSKLNVILKQDWQKEILNSYSQ